MSICVNFNVFRIFAASQQTYCIHNYAVFFKVVKDLIKRSHWLNFRNVNFYELFFRIVSSFAHSNNFKYLLVYFYLFPAHQPRQPTNSSEIEKFHSPNSFAVGRAVKNDFVTSFRSLHHFELLIEEKICKFFPVL